MSTPAIVTEAHLLLAEQLIQDTKLSSIAQLIADSEARAINAAFPDSSDDSLNNVRRLRAEVRHDRAVTPPPQLIRTPFDTHLVLDAAVVDAIARGHEAGNTEFRDLLCEHLARRVVKTAMVTEGQRVCTPIPVTEAHYTLRRDVIFSAPDEGAQLIAAIGVLPKQKKGRK